MMAVRMPARAPVLRRPPSASVMHRLDVASAQRLEQQDDRERGQERQGEPAEVVEEGQELDLPVDLRLGMSHRVAGRQDLLDESARQLVDQRPIERAFRRDMLDERELVGLLPARSRSSSRRCRCCRRCCATG